MLFTDVIRRKRDGHTLTPGEIDYFVRGLTDGSIPAEQVSAMAMAIFLKSMTVEEAGLLTMAMSRSGTVLDWSDVGLDGPVVDKHSTGGVGDKVSFLLAPLAAACGCYVPMISGRGLGHTGGTLDKIGSIPGYDPLPGLDRFREVVRSVGCAIIGQTSELAPADRRFYAIRDVTGTVESVPLITASILSKKIAAGLTALVMDVKCGNGAFMPTLDRAMKLTRSIIGTAQSSGLTTHALITDMNETLGHTAGNALEIGESMAYLRGEDREPRLHDVVVGLTAQMLIAGELESDDDAARSRVIDALESGRAAETFGRMVAALGGPADFVERYEHYLPRAGVELAVTPRSAGYLQAVDCFQVGNTVVELGGGRQTLDDTLDLAVGLSHIAPIGSEVGPDRPLAIIHAASEPAAEHAEQLLSAACTVGKDKPANRPAVIDRQLP